MPPSTGEITQLAAMLLIVPQLAAFMPPAAMPAPRTAPTMEWVVDTGAPMAVAKFSHKAPASNEAVISQMKRLLSRMASGLMMPPRIVATTSPPAIRAPAISKMAAMTMAPVMVMACEPTAGPTLLATSLAPMFIAM
ncbi:hypothetical protein SDC9_184193 [bioreactor metagenome]|uniref:Uncharacterized protein n=1 Tax=bioreactor metagenome TaxID=1076179 RepID=A0A645HMK2_9ZZZZ